MAPWTLGGPELLEMNSPFITDQFPLLLDRKADFLASVSCRQVAPSIPFLSAQSCSTLSGCLVLCGRRWGGGTGQHTEGEQALWGDIPAQTSTAPELGAAPDPSWPPAASLCARSRPPGEDSCVPRDPPSYPKPPTQSSFILLLNSIGHGTAGAAANCPPLGQA